MQDDTSMEVMIRAQVLAEDDDGFVDGMVEDVTLGEEMDIISLQANLVRTYVGDDAQGLQGKEERNLMQELQASV